MTNPDLILLVCHTVKMKKGISKLAMLLLPNIKYSRGETYHKLNQPSEQNSVPLPEQTSYQKDKVLIFVLTAGMPLGSSTIWGHYGNKGSSFVHWNPIKNGQQVNDLLAAILLPSEIATTEIEAHT